MLTEISLGVKCCLPEKFGVLPYFCIGTFEKSWSQNKKVGVK